MNVSVFDYKFSVLSFVLIASEEARNPHSADHARFSRRFRTAISLHREVGRDKREIETSLDGISHVSQNEGRTTPDAAIIVPRLHQEHHELQWRPLRKVRMAILRRRD
ncbi:MAG: hypothetical protein J4G05_08115 [Chlorobi bacterium]|nr:hypothetical protein [Chlorobiota bacterium]